MQTALVVDDDQVSAGAVGHILELRGFRALLTDNPGDAARYCREFKLHLIVADVVLRSALSGIDLARQIRQECPDIPILFVSGTPIEGWSRSDLENAEALLPGRVAFLLKPFTADALSSTISDLLGESFSDAGLRKLMESARVFRGWRTTDPA